MLKQIDYILTGREKSIGVETILQPLPHKDFRFANPFIVLHHLQPKYFAPNSSLERIQPHPHRGFAPVTFMFQGEGFHKDSKGNSGFIKAGEVQWMFAGNGLLHSEGPSKELMERGGYYEFVQLWVNVPAQHKWDEPYYQQATTNDMPSVFNREGDAIKLASGTYDKLEGPLQSFTPVISAFGSVAAGEQIQFVAAEGYWTLLYVLEGSASVNDKDIQQHQLIVFNKANTDIVIQTKEKIKLLYLSAEPIEEPVAAKGNIVMNTQQEVEQAELDYAEGKFGVLKD
jgi:redox-sensitive bicupin YhaK (pirin superfamily)